MTGNDLISTYLKRVSQLFDVVDLERLDKSCNSKDNKYAKGVLKDMNEIFVDVYRTNSLVQDRYWFVYVPAVIRGIKTGHIGIGLVLLDLRSSGEHWNTYFLTPMGLIDQNEETITPEEAKYLTETYIPYQYWYTVGIGSDSHVDFDNIPDDAADILRACRKIRRPPGRRSRKANPSTPGENSQPEKLCVIDRFEGDYAVIEYGDTTFNFPADLLPENAEEGDVINFTAAVDDDKTAQRQLEVKAKAAKIFKE